MIEHMTELVLQLGVILFAARIGGDLARRVRLPSVIGELVAGMLIGPYLLGGIAFFGFPEGLFPLPEGQMLPVRPELYGIATIASILLLFNAGLETDIATLFRFSVAGLTVGIGGVVVSFLAGSWITAVVTGTPIVSPLCLFMGAISTATSVGVTTRLLQETRRIDSPEGVTTLTGAVIDDVIGIIILAVVVGLHAAVGGASGTGVSWSRIAFMAARAVGVWLGVTALGLIFSDQIANFLKRFRSVTAFSILALALSLLMAGAFEKAGLAMIIGAYVTGLALSRTDVHYVIESELRPLSSFLVPVFFTVTGLFVNLSTLFSPTVLVFGLSYAVVSILSKLLGCGGPALFVNFNRLGALRIGLGMVPRSEVALIIASTGLSYHVLNEDAFGATVVMVLLSVLIAPPLLAVALRNPARGTRKEIVIAERVSLTFDFPSPDLADILAPKVVQYFRGEGFFIHVVENDTRVYHINRDRTHVTLTLHPHSFIFEMAEQDRVLVRAVVYEALLDLHKAIGTLKDLAMPESMRRELAGEVTSHKVGNLGKVVRPESVVPHLSATTKEGVIKELLEVLSRGGKLQDKTRALEDVMARERSMSTGMQFGIAIPHAKTDAVTSITVAVGLRPEGIDFQSIDGEPSTIFILVLSPKNVAGPHIRFLADVSALLNEPSARERLLASRTKSEIATFFEGR